MTQIRRQPLCPYRLARSTQGRRQKESQIIEEGVGVWGGGGEKKGLGGKTEGGGGGKKRPVSGGGVFSC